MLSTFTKENNHVPDTIADTYYMQLPTGGVTQGDIWSHLPANTGGDSRCDGVIITPRCDFAHSKSPVLNYLPIVSLEHYLIHVACLDLLEHSRNDACENAGRKAEPIEIDNLLELGVPIKEALAIAEKVRDTWDQSEEKKKGKAYLEFVKICEKISSIDEMLKSGPMNLNEAAKLIGFKQVERVQRDIIRNNNSDTYFLPPCLPLIDKPSVVLLRHIYTCSTDLLTFNGHYGRGGNAGRRERQPERLLRLRSPFIESLMSKFAALFTRVGTRDLPASSITGFMIQLNKDTNELVRHTT
jgi:hypothetical protein